MIHETSKANTRKEWWITDFKVEKKMKSSHVLHMLSVTDTRYPPAAYSTFLASRRKQLEDAKVESTKKVTSLVILSKADQLVPLMGSIEACVAPSFWFYEIVCTFFCNRECEAPEPSKQTVADCLMTAALLGPFPGMLSARAPMLFDDEEITVCAHCNVVHYSVCDESTNRFCVYSTCDHFPDYKAPFSSLFQEGKAGQLPHMHDKYLKAALHATLSHNTSGVLLVYNHSAVVRSTIQDCRGLAAENSTQQAWNKLYSSFGPVTLGTMIFDLSSK